MIRNYITTNYCLLYIMLYILLIIILLYIQYIYNCIKYEAFVLLCNLIKKTNINLILPNQAVKFS